VPVNFSSNVIVRPTQEQIHNATIALEYDSNIVTQTRCPITLGDFETGEIVRQIRHCGHTFCETALQNWFGSNVRCPVCRYDIRTYVRPDTPPSPVTTNENETNENETNENETNENETNENEIYQNLTASITDIMQSYSENPQFDLSFSMIYY